MLIADDSPRLEIWQALTIAIVTGLVGVSAALFTGVREVVNAWFARWKSGVGRVQHFQGIKEIAKWHSIIESIRALPYVDRVLVFTGRNGGGVPKPGKPYYVCCTGGWSTLPDSHPERLYAGPLIVDAAYMNLIVETIAAGKVLANTEAMPKEAMLRKYYEEEKVIESVFYLLSLDSAEMIYCSVATYTKTFLPHELARVEMVVDQVRGLMGTSLSHPVLT